MKRCDFCGRLRFRLPVTDRSLRFCSEACKGAHLWGAFLKNQDKIVTALRPGFAEPVCAECGCKDSDFARCDGRILCAACHERHHAEAWLRDLWAAVEAQP